MEFVTDTYMHESPGKKALPRQNACATLRHFKDITVEAHLATSIGGGDYCEVLIVHPEEDQGGPRDFNRF